MSNNISNGVKLRFIGPLLISVQCTEITANLETVMKVLIPANLGE